MKRPFPSSLVSLFQNESIKVRNLSYKNHFDLHENETACRGHFDMNGFAFRLVLKQRHKRTRKWPILPNFDIPPKLKIAFISL